MAERKKKNAAQNNETVAVRIPRSLRKRAKALAVHVERDLQDVLAEILEEGLAKRNV